MKTQPEFFPNTLTNPNQLIDLKVLKQNFNSPLRSGQFVNKYLPEHQTIHKCLPARFNAHPIFGQLIIKFQSIVFLSNVPASKSKNVIYRCRMLGYSQEETPFLSDSITYTIHTNNKMFKHYLKDMKVCLVQILDSRNYEPIGHSYINWLTYMKSTEDNQLLTEKHENQNKQEQSKSLKRYYLPFLDEQCILNLPLFDYRNIKNVSTEHNNRVEGQNLATKASPKERIIGEIHLKFMSHIYEHPIAPGYLSIESQSKYGLENEPNKYKQQIEATVNQNEAKANVFPSCMEIPYSNNVNTNPISKKMISLKQLAPSSKNIYSQQRQDSFGSESSGKQPETLQLRKKQSNPLIFDLQKRPSQTPQNNLYKIGANRSKLSNNQDHVKINDRFSHDTDKTSLRNQISKTNELELLHLKMDVEEFFKNETQLKYIPKQEKTFLQITKLKTKLLNINHLDVIFNENQEQLNSQNKQNITSKPHIKIYKVSTDKNKNQEFFNSKIIVERPGQRIIEIHLPNNQGKCIFRCKDLTAISNDICLYNKGVIVGVLLIKKQTQKREIISDINNFFKNDIKKTIQSQNPSDSFKPSTNKICIVVVQNFAEQIPKKSDLNELSNLDNYTIGIKNVQFVHESLKNSKQAGEYAITNCQGIPKVFAIEAKNSYNEFVGMSQNINFEGNQIILTDQNIMPTLILEKNLSINFKQMPVFKKLPNSVSFRLSIYIANTDQLNYFINKWKQRLQKIRAIQIRKERSISNTRQVVSKHTDKGYTQKVKERQYTLSDEVSETRNKENQRIRTESQNKTIDINDIKYKNIESKSSGVRQSEKQRFKTQGNYTEDLNNQILLGNVGQQNKQNQEQYSQKQGHDDDEQEIYLVQFFCKSLHYVLCCLGSKKIIQSKITELNNYHYTNKSAQIQQSKSISQDNQISQSGKGLVSKQQFARILSLLIGQNNQANVEVLGFDVNQILQALFVSEDGNFIKMQQFTLCLMAYFNFLLLLVNQKITALKQVILCQPQAEQKLSKIHNSMTNINFEFLWEDVLSNVIQKTKQKICKRYRIYPNTPFSVNFLLKEIRLVKKNINDSSDQSFFKNLLDVLVANEQKNYELFMKTTADLGSLVRQTVEEIIFTQCLKSLNIKDGNNWIEGAIKKLEQFVRGENMESIESVSKNENGQSLNLTQFQELFSRIGIETSIWQSLMLIEEIKVWYEGDETREKQSFEGGEGIIAIKLVISWLNGLRTKIEMRNELRNVRGEMKTKSSRLNSAKSLDSDQEDIIEQMNKRKSPKGHEKQQFQTDFLKQDQEQKKQHFNQAPIKSKKQPWITKSSQKLQNQTYRRKQIVSLKQSQTLNNQSDIANIANLLRQNENNLYFLPSVTDPRTLPNINSVNHILSNQNILKAIDQPSLRNPPFDSSPSKFIKKLSKKQPQIFQLQSNSSQFNQSQSSRISNPAISNQPIHAFLSVQIKELTLKKKDFIYQKQGLKKLCLSFKTKSTKSDKQSSQNNGQNTKYDEYYFLSLQEVDKILANEKSAAYLGKYAIKNMKLDMNSLYQFETVFNQGFCLEIVNLSNNRSSSKSNNKSFNEFDKVEQVLLAGILPIEDIVKQIQDYKQKIYPEAKENKQKRSVQSKKKTIVLYSGREIVGKAVAQISVSNQEFSNTDENFQEQKRKMTKINLSLSRKQLKGPKSKYSENHKFQTLFLMSLWYCSVRNEQKISQILPIIGENTCYQIELPEPIIEQQLIVRNIEKKDELMVENNLEGPNFSQISRFTRFDKSSLPNPIEYQIVERKQQIKQGNHECVIPLETLYFRKSIDQSYPMIDKESGRFVCSINVHLEIINHMTSNGNQQRIIQLSKTQQSQQNQI